MKRALPTQAGAALLTALLSVALIASLAATALWQQWRLTEVEASERARLQAQWVLAGALDWGRLILSEDARQGNNIDHLGEPWALPLKDARLASFLAADKTVRADDIVAEAFLAGRIEDLQGRLNVRNLVQERDVSTPDLQMFQRLFELLGLPGAELQRMALALRDALQPGQAQGVVSGFVPQRVEQLVWLGLSPASLQRLRPYITWLPERTGLNLNTASAEVLSASTNALPLALARRLAEDRRLKPWRSLDEANRDVGGQLAFRDQVHVFGTHYFLVSGQLRQAQHVLQAQALVRRDNRKTRIVWRDLRPVGAEELTQTGR